ncbi:MAG: putative Zn-dependent protease [Granulosicoccus sp.]
MSGQTDLPYKFVVLNNDALNVWALPGGKIAINRGLLVLLKDEAQLATVLGHEVVHAAVRHGASQNVARDFTPARRISSAARYGVSQELEADYYGIAYM